MIHVSLQVNSSQLLLSSNLQSLYGLVSQYSNLQLDSFHQISLEISYIIEAHMKASTHNLADIL